MKCWFAQNLGGCMTFMAVFCLTTVVTTVVLIIFVN